MLETFVLQTYASITSYHLEDGMQVPFCYINAITNGLFIKMFLFVTFMIFLLGAYFMQRRSVGSGDIPSNLAVAGLVTSVLAVILRLVKYNGASCLVDGWTLSVTVIIAGMSVLWLLFSRD